MTTNIILTGASGDIGAAIARTLGQPSANLLLTGFKNAEALKALATELSAKGARVMTVCADLGTKEGCDAVLAAADRFFLGAPTLLVNNAGLSHVELFQDSTDENLLEILNANLTSVVRLTKETVRRMLPEKSGRIINITSVWGEVGASTEVEYSMTKGGVIAFTKALAKELAPSGIPVNAVSPGAIDTKMNACHSAEDLRALADEIPMGRLGTPEEVAELVALLAKAPEYLTGQIIRIDGGWI